MCEQTKIVYADGEIVWVKLGSLWWPGEVCAAERLPDGLLASMRKVPIVVVKFFQENSYEYVKNLSDIYQYHCARKHEFIKKGLDLYRSNNAYVKKFPSDVCTAEHRTGGNPNIIGSSEFAPEQKPDISEIFGTASRRQPKNSPRGRGGKNRPAGRLVSPHHGYVNRTDHVSRILSSQTSSSIQPKRPTNSSSAPSTPASGTKSEAKYNCQFCGYSTNRLNVIVLHSKSHSNKSPAASQDKKKPTIVPRPTPPANVFQPTALYQRQRFAGRTATVTSNIIDSSFDSDDDATTTTTTTTETTTTDSGPSTSRYVRKNHRQQKVTPKGKAATTALKRHSLTAATTAFPSATSGSLITKHTTIPNSSKQSSKSLDKTEKTEIKKTLLADWSDSDDDSKMTKEHDVDDKIGAVASPVRDECKKDELIKETGSAGGALNIELATDKLKYRNIPKKDRSKLDQFYDNSGMKSTTVSQSAAMVEPSSSSVIVLDTDESDDGDDGDDVKASKQNDENSVDEKDDELKGIDDEKSVKAEKSLSNEDTSDMPKLVEEQVVDSEETVTVVPVDDTPANDTPTNDTPTIDTPTNDTPTNDTPTNDTLTNDTPTNDAPAIETPVDKTTAVVIVVDSKVQKDEEQTESPEISIRSRRFKKKIDVVNHKKIDKNVKEGENQLDAEVEDVNLTIEMGTKAKDDQQEDLAELKEKVPEEMPVNVEVENHKELDSNKEPDENIVLPPEPTIDIEKVNEEHIEDVKTPSEKPIKTVTKDLDIDHKADNGLIDSVEIIDKSLTKEKKRGKLKKSKRKTETVTDTKELELGTKHETEVIEKENQDQKEVAEFDEEKNNIKEKSDVEQNQEKLVELKDEKMDEIVTQSDQLSLRGSSSDSSRKRLRKRTAALQMDYVGESRRSSRRRVTASPSPEELVELVRKIDEKCAEIERQQRRSTDESTKVELDATTNEIDVNVVETLPNEQQKSMANELDASPNENDKSTKEIDASTDEIVGSTNMIDVPTNEIETSSNELEASTNDVEPPRKELESLTNEPEANELETSTKELETLAKRDEKPTIKIEDDMSEEKDLQNPSNDIEAEIIENNQDDIVVNKKSATILEESNSPDIVPLSPIPKPSDTSIIDEDLIKPETIEPNESIDVKTNSISTDMSSVHETILTSSPDKVIDTSTSISESLIPQFINKDSPTKDRKDSISSDKNDSNKSIDCFAFTEEEDEEIPKKLSRKKRRCYEPGKVFELEPIDTIEAQRRQQEEEELKRLAKEKEENDNRLATEIDNLLTSTTVSVMPQLPIAIPRTSIGFDNQLDKLTDKSLDKLIEKSPDKSIDKSPDKSPGKDEDGKDRSLPPKERNKRIFKSRNRNRSNEMDNESQRLSGELMSKEVRTSIDSTIVASSSVSEERKLESSEPVQLELKSLESVTETKPLQVVLQETIINEQKRLRKIKQREMEVLQATAIKAKDENVYEGELSEDKSFEMDASLVEVSEVPIQSHTMVSLEHQEYQDDIEERDNENFDEICSPQYEKIEKITDKIEMDEEIDNKSLEEIEEADKEELENIQKSLTKPIVEDRVNDDANDAILEVNVQNPRKRHLQSFEVDTPVPKAGKIVDTSALNLSKNRIEKKFIEEVVQNPEKPSLICKIPIIQSDFKLLSGNERSDIKDIQVLHDDVISVDQKQILIEPKIMSFEEQSTIIPVSISNFDAQNIEQLAVGQAKRSKTNAMRDVATTTLNTKIADTKDSGNLQKIPSQSTTKLILVPLPASQSSKRVTISNTKDDDLIARLPKKRKSTVEMGEDIPAFIIKKPNQSELSSDHKKSETTSKHKKIVLTSSKSTIIPTVATAVAAPTSAPATTTGTITKKLSIKSGQHSDAKMIKIEKAVQHPKTIQTVEKVTEKPGHLFFNEPLTSDNLDKMPLVLTGNREVKIVPIEMNSSKSSIANVPPSSVSTKPSISIITIPASSTKKIQKIVITKGKLKKIENVPMTTSQSMSSTTVSAVQSMPSITTSSITTIQSMPMVKPTITASVQSMPIVKPVVTTMSTMSTMQVGQSIKPSTVSVNTTSKPTVGQIIYTTIVLTTPTVSINNTSPIITTSPNVSITNSCTSISVPVPIPTKRKRSTSKKGQITQTTIYQKQIGTDGKGNPVYTRCKVPITKPPTIPPTPSGTSVIPKGTFVHAGNGQICITSKGSLITTSSQTHSSSPMRNINTSPMPRQIMSETKVRKTILSPSRIQVQSQKIIRAATPTAPTTPTVPHVTKQHLLFIKKTVPPASTAAIKNIVPSSSTITVQPAIIPAASIAVEKTVPKSTIGTTIISKNRIVHNQQPTPSSSTTTRRDVIKMSPQKLAEMERLGYIEEKPDGKVLTMSGYRKIQKQDKPITKKTIVKRVARPSVTTTGSSMSATAPASIPAPMPAPMPAPIPAPMPIPTPAPIQTITMKPVIGAAPVVTLSSSVTEMPPLIPISPTKEAKTHLLPFSTEEIVPAPQTSSTSILETSEVEMTPIAQIPIESANETVETAPTPEQSSIQEQTTLLRQQLSQTQDLLALPGDGFGGPPNSYFLCTLGENGTFIPIDNQPLYLDSSNQLIPSLPEEAAIAETDGMQSFDEIAGAQLIQQQQLLEYTGEPDTILATEQELAQLQDATNPTFLINTNDGQQILLDQQGLLALTAGGDIQQFMTTDGQQIILPQDILSALALNEDISGAGGSRGVGLSAGEHILIPEELALIQDPTVVASNQDILAAALAGTEGFSQEQYIGDVMINSPNDGNGEEMTVDQQQSGMSFHGIAQPAATHTLTNQTNATNAILMQPPIMSTLEQPTKTDKVSPNSSLDLSGQNLDESLAVIGVTSHPTNIPTSLELPITITNPAIAPKTTSNAISLSSIYPTSTGSIVGLTSNNQLSVAISSTSGSGHDLDTDGILIATNNGNGSSPNSPMDMDSNSDIIPVTPESVTANHRHTPDISGFTPEDSNSNSSNEIPLQPNLVLRSGDFHHQLRLHEQQQQSLEVQHQQQQPHNNHYISNSIQSSGNDDNDSGGGGGGGTGAGDNDGGGSGHVNDDNPNAGFNDVQYIVDEQTLSGVVEFNDAGFNGR